jgi:glycosyltransferase 2 family protein
MRRPVRAVLIFLLTAGLLAFSLHNADLGGVLAETRRAEPVPLLLALVATFATYVLRAWRWQSLLAPIGATRFSVAFRTTVIGFAASFLLPARAGEVIRPYLLARRERLSATAAFATVVLERLLDLVVVLLLFASFVFTAAPGVVTGDPALLARVKVGGAFAGAASVIGLALLFALAGHPERLGRLALKIEGVLPARLARAVAKFVETFAQGLAVMRQPGRLVVALVLSVPLWMSIALGIWLTSRAFHITFPYPASFLVMTILVVGVAVPTPGAIGGFHAAYRIAVQMFFGAPPDRALGGAFVLHAISFLPVTILGAIFMFSEGLTLTGVRELAESAPAPPADQSTGAGARAAGSGPMEAGAPAAGNQRYDARAGRDGRAAMVPPGKRSAR